MRATAATNALSNDAEIAKVQEWLGHANVSTTGARHVPEDSPDIPREVLLVWFI